VLLIDPVDDNEAEDEIDEEEVDDADAELLVLEDMTFEVEDTVPGDDDKLLVWSLVDDSEGIIFVEPLLELLSLPPPPVVVEDEGEDDDDKDREEGLLSLDLSLVLEEPSVVEEDDSDDVLVNE
jgi:hypothetical protein